MERSAEPSSTALGCAFFRAHHAENDASKIFNDFLAARFLTEEDRASWATKLAGNLQASRPGEDLSKLDPRVRVGEALRASAAPAIALSRARFAEDHLESAISAGATQYVILGAGFDTFALRRADLRDALQVFEIDHPATQQSKRARLAAAGLTIPPNLHFLPADFERETVFDVLRRSREYQTTKTAFISWLGVTMYLAGEAIANVLRSIHRATAVGSRLVFDYIDVDGFDATKAAPRVTRMMEITRKVGEPMVFGFEPARLPSELASFGFRVLESIAPETIQARYFAGRNDGLRATEHVHLVLSQVA